MAGNKNQLSEVFIKNQGQVKTEKGAPANEVLFYKPGQMELFITTSGFSTVVKTHTGKATTYNKVDFTFANVHIQKEQIIFVNSNNASINFYSPKNQFTSVSVCKTVLIKNIYPGIDWLWSINNKGVVSHDFMVNIDADASLINYTVQGADIAEKSGNILNYAAKGFTIKEGPVIFQDEKKDLKGEIQIKGNNVSFKFPDEMKKGGFTIDPPLQLDWSLGWVDTTNQTGFRDIVADDSLNTFSVGYSNNYTLPVFPQGYGSYTSQNPENIDAVIMKCDPYQNLVWATFFGGSNNDEANAVTASPSGIFVAGYSESWDFPVAAIEGQYNSYYNLVSLTGRDAFITKFNRVGQLEWSTGYGGDSADEAQSIKYYNGNIYVGGYTRSGHFPVQQYGGAYFYNDTNRINADGFLLMFDTVANRKWATCFGGSGNDYISSLFADVSGIYITGYSDSIGSQQIPLVSHGSSYYQNTYHNTESFIGNFSLAGALTWSTYFGGNGNDIASSVLRNNKGLFTCGKTDNSGLPVMDQGNGNYYQANYGGGISDGFIAKFDPNNWNELYCTYYGNTGNDALTNLATDAFNNTIFTGFSDGPLTAAYTSPQFFLQSAKAGGFDGIMLGLDSNQHSFWSTYFGSAGNDFGLAVQFSIPYIVDIVGETFYNFGQDTIGGTYPTDNCSNICPFVTCNGVTNRFYNTDSISIILGYGGGGGGNGGNGCNQPLFFQKLIPLRATCPNQCNGIAKVDTSNVYGCPPYSLLWSDGTVNGVDTSLCTSYWNRITDMNGNKRTLYSRFNVLHVLPTTDVYTDCGIIPNWDSLIKPAGGEKPYVITPRGTTVQNCVAETFFAITDSVGCVISDLVTWTQSNVNLTPALTLNSSCGIIANINQTPSNCFNDQHSSNWQYIIYSGGDTLTSSYNRPDNQQLTNPSQSGFYTGYLDMGDCRVPLTGVFRYTTPDYTIHYLASCLGSSNGSITVLINPDTAALAKYGADTVYLSLLDSTSRQQVAIGSPLIMTSNNPDSLIFNNLDNDAYEVSVYHNACDSSVTHVKLSGMGLSFDYDSLICGDTSYIVVHVKDSSAPFSYNWSSTATGWQPVGLYSDSALITQAGSYTVIVTDANGCHGTRVDTVVGSNAVVIDSIGLSNVQCPFNPPMGSGYYAANAYVSGGSTPYTYNWDDGESNQTAYDINPLNTYGLTVTDANNCTSTLTYTAPDLPAPLYVTDSAINSACNNNHGQIFITVSGGFMNPYDDIYPYQVSYDGGYLYYYSVDYTGYIFNNTYVDNGSYYYYVTDYFGCSYSDTFSITAPTPITMQVTDSSISCFLGSDGYIALSNIQNATGPYTVWVNNQVYYFDSTAIMFDSIPASYYNISFADSNQCQFDTTITLAQPDNLFASIIPGTGINCYGGADTILVTAQGGTQPYTNTGTFYATAGNFYDTVTDSHGCFSIVSQTQILQPSQIIIDSNFLINGVTCTGRNDAVINITAIGGTPQYLYGLSQYPQPPLLQYENIFTGVAPGSYEVLVTDSYGCTDSLPVVIAPFVPGTDSLQIDSATCYGSNTGVIKVFAQPANRNPYTFSLNDGPAQVYNVFYNLVSGNYQIIVSDTNQCMDTLHVFLGQPDSIDGRVWLNGTPLPEDSFILTNRDYASFTKLSNNPWTVTFSPPSPYTANSDTLIQVQPRENLTYTVTIYMDSVNKDCFIQYQGLIAVVELPEIPNTITPNGDGFNDVWKIDQIRYPNAVVTIFDRWGEVVYTSTDYNNDWGGIDEKNNRPLPDGAYFYILKVPSLNNAVFKGDLNIVDAKH